MRFRLRYMNHDLELNEGEFVVGRNASCQLSLDDPLVSRRHATFTVHADSVTVEDLGSRNGVSLNGERLVGRVLLRPGDRVQIGSQEMVLVVSASEGVRTATRNPMENDATQAPRHRVALEQAAELVGARSGSEHGAARRRVQLARERRREGARDGQARRGRAHPGVSARGRDRGEPAGKRITPSLLDQAARFSARLATATGKGAWADYVIELYQSQQRIVPGARHRRALQRVSSRQRDRSRPPPRLRVGSFGISSATFGPAERFLFQRLEGLERLAAIR